MSTEYQITLFAASVSLGGGNLSFRIALLSVMPDTGAGHLIEAARRRHADKATLKP